jgi:hypothetical protein
MQFFSLIEVSTYYGFRKKIRLKEFLKFMNVLKFLSSIKYNIKKYDYVGYLNLKKSL